MSDSIIAYIDGASRGNPGPAAAAFILTGCDETQLQAKAFFLGETTNMTYLPNSKTGKSGTLPETKTRKPISS
ncbi:MAG: hypothetical protein NTX52_07845 [Planctomycetota bacterium]|nr:hypothetical protein [Planctomycetota bacterium]